MESMQLAESELARDERRGVVRGQASATSKCPFAFDSRSDPRQSSGNNSTAPVRLRNDFTARR